MSRLKYVVTALIWVVAMLVAVWWANQLISVATHDWLYPSCQMWSGRCNWVFIAGGIAPTMVFLVALYGYWYSYWRLTRR